MKPRAALAAPVQRVLLLVLLPGCLLGFSDGCGGPDRVIWQDQALFDDLNATVDRPHGLPMDDADDALVTEAVAKRLVATWGDPSLYRIVLDGDGDAAFGLRGEEPVDDDAHATMTALLENLTRLPPQRIAYLADAFVANRTDGEREGRGVPVTTYHVQIPGPWRLGAAHAGDVGDGMAVDWQLAYPSKQVALVDGNLTVDMAGQAVYAGDWPNEEDDMAIARVEDELAAAGIESDLGGAHVESNWC